MPEWSEIYEDHVEFVYKFLYNMLGNKQDAQDVTQETFIKAFHKLDQFDYKSKLSTWLIVIARNLAIDRIRRTQRGAILNKIFKRQSSNVELDSAERLIQSETRVELMRVIYTLKPDYRTVVILKGLQEYSTQEIALVLNWSESKVRVSYHRAIKILRKKLSEEGSVCLEII